MDIKSMNFAAECSSASQNTEKTPQNIVPPRTDNILSVGFGKESNKEVLILEIQEKSKVEEYKRINLLLNKETNFIIFFQEISDCQKIFFAFEKPRVYLLEFLNSETLNDLIRISLYKQSIDIIIKLREIAKEKFYFFNAYLFFVETEKENVSSYNPLLKILYQSEIESYDSKNNLFSKNEVFWLFYLFNLIFKDNSTFFRANENDQHNLIQFDSSINKEMNQLNVCLKEKINAIQVNSSFAERISSQTLFEVISIFNNVLEKKKLPRISHNISIKFDNMLFNPNNCNSNAGNINASLNSCTENPVITSSLSNDCIINPSNENKNQNNLNPNFEYFIKKNNLIDNYLNENIINYFDKEKSFIENNKNFNKKANDKKENSEKTQINSTININGNFNNININSENVYNNNNNSKLKNNNIFEFINYKNINQTSYPDTTNYFNDIPFNINFQKNNNSNNFDLTKSNVNNSIPKINSSISNKSSPIQHTKQRYIGNSENFNCNKLNFVNNSGNLKDLNYQSNSINQLSNSINNNFSKNFNNQKNQTIGSFDNYYKIKDFPQKKKELSNNNFSPINSIIFNNNNKTNKSSKNNVDTNYHNRSNLLENLNLDVLFHTQNNSNAIDILGMKNNFSFHNFNHKTENQTDYLEIPNNRNINDQLDFLNQNFSKQNVDIAQSFASLFNNFPTNCNNLNQTHNSNLNQQRHLENNFIDRINENKFENYNNLNNINDLNNFINQQKNYNYLDNIFKESSKNQNFDLENLFGKINNYLFYDKFLNENQSDYFTNYNNSNFFNLDTINKLIANNNSNCNNNKNINLETNVSNKYLLTFKDLKEIFNPNGNGNFYKCNYDNSIPKCDQSNNSLFISSNITQAFQDYNNLLNSNYSNFNNNITPTEQKNQQNIENQYNTTSKSGLYNNNNFYESSLASNNEYKSDYQNLNYGNNCNNILNQNYVNEKKNSLFKDQLKDESFDKPINKIESSFKNFDDHKNSFSHSNKYANEITEELNYLQNLQDNDKDRKKLCSSINSQANRHNTKNYSIASSNKTTKLKLETDINKLDSKSEKLLCFNDISVNSKINKPNQIPNSESYSIKAPNIFEKNIQKINKKNLTDSFKNPKTEKNSNRKDVNNHNGTFTNNVTLLESYEYINDTPGEYVILSRTYSYENFPNYPYINKGNNDKINENYNNKKNFKKNKSNSNTETYYFKDEEDNNPSFAGEFNPKIKSLEMLKKLKLEEEKSITAEDNFCMNEENCKNSEREINNSIQLNNKEIEIFNDITTRMKSNTKELIEDFKNSSLEDLIKKFSINNKNNKEVEQILKSINNFKEAEKYEMISKILSLEQKTEENQISEKKDNCNYKHKRILRKRSLSINKNKKIKAKNQQLKDINFNSNKSEQNNKIDNNKLTTVKKIIKNAKIKNIVKTTSKANSNSKVMKVDSNKEVSYLSSSSYLNEVDEEHFLSHNKPYDFIKKEFCIKKKNNKEINNIESEKEEFTHLSDLSLVENLSETKQDFVHNLKSLLLEANLNTIILDKKVWSLYKLRIKDKQQINHENSKIKLKPVLSRNNSNFFTIEKSQKINNSQKSFLKNKRKLEKIPNTSKHSGSYLNDVLSPSSKFKNQNNKAKTAEKEKLNSNYSSEEDYFYLNSKEKACSNINNNKLYIISDSSNYSQSGKKQINKNFIENIGKKTVNYNITPDISFNPNSANYTKNFTNLKEDLKAVNNSNTNNSNNSGQIFVPNKYTKNSLNVHSFSKSDLEIIDKVNFPRRKKVKSEIAGKDGKSDNKNLITTKTDIFNYADVYPKELEEILENERHVFMRNNFKNMYTIKNFYLYIKLNKLRRLNIKDFVVDFERVNSEKHKNEKVVSKFDSITDKRNNDKFVEPLAEKSKTNEELYDKNLIGEKMFENSNVEIVDENIILIGKRIADEYQQNIPQNEIYSILKKNSSEKKSIENVKFNEENQSLNFNNKKKKHISEGEYEKQATNSEQKLAESPKIKQLLLFENKDNNNEKTDLIENSVNFQNDYSKVLPMNITKTIINQEFKENIKELNHNSIKKIEQEIYKSIDEDNSDNSQGNKSIKFASDPINKNEKMEIEECSSYSSKIKNTITDQKVEEYGLNNLENSNLRVSMDIVENISICNSNSIPYDLEEKENSIIQNKNISKKKNFLNKENEIKSNNKNEEIHKLNIFDVGTVDNLGDFFVVSPELKVYTVNNYLSIKTEGNTNEPNYIIEINKNIFCDEFNNTIEENLQKKIEDNVVDTIIPNLETKKLWDPNLINQDKLDEYILKSKDLWNEEYIWSEEVALNFLKNMKYDTIASLEKLKENSDDIFSMIKESCMTKSAFETYGKNKYKKARTRLGNN